MVRLGIASWSFEVEVSVEALARSSVPASRLGVHCLWGVWKQARHSRVGGCSQLNCDRLEGGSLAAAAEASSLRW